MTRLPTSTLPNPGAAAETAGPAPDRWMVELGMLLNELENASPDGTALAATAADRVNDELARRRLAIAACLFAALQCKHATTAGHSMRVALTSSAWAARLNFDEAGREELEIAALLHDIGIIGAPDHVLLKPAKLDSDEMAIMTRARAMSLEILCRGCGSAEVLGIVANVATWYDGSRGPSGSAGTDLAGENIPLAARMIAVAEAFDAMTTDRVYRPAFSQERAMAELFRCAGTQFDPILVRQFVEMLEGDREKLRKEVATRWLLALDRQAADAYWEFTAGPPPEPSSTAPSQHALFESRLLDHMYDAVVFVDAGGRIVAWNHGCERLTGIPGASIRQQHWRPETLKLADEKGRDIAADECPVLNAIDSGVQSLRRLTLSGRSGRRVSVDSHVIPVIGGDGVIQGAILVLHDASSEISLEQRCQSLADKAARDPLTQVANRAEFDRVHAMFVAAHQQQQAPCSLLMCDLDRFKLVNDNYGHQAGDDAIKCLATLLKGVCHPGDFVARYGGEEFVVILADCDNMTAWRRADQIRVALSQIPQPKMDGKSITVSIGATEIQPGDTAEAMLRRADRALLMAKENGRNQVVQLGGGMSGQAGMSADEAPGNQGDTPLAVEQTLVTNVPAAIAIEKLRGFVADHNATIVAVDGNRIQLRLVERGEGLLRRLTDRPASYHFDVRIEEQRVLREAGNGNSASGGVLRTQIRVVITPRASRDRRRGDALARAQQMLVSLRSYLMAASAGEEAMALEDKSVKAKHGLMPWLARKTK